MSFHIHNSEGHKLYTYKAGHEAAPELRYLPDTGLGFKPIQFSTLKGAALCAAMHGGEIVPVRAEPARSLNGGW
jgi:hypothetical protein